MYNYLEVCRFSKFFVALLWALGKETRSYGYRWYVRLQISMIIPVFCLQDHSSRRCRPYFQPSPRKFSVDLNPIGVRPFASETIVHRDLWRRPLIVLLIFQTPKSPCLTWTWRHFEYWVDLFLSRRLHFFLIFVWLLLFSSSSLLHPPTPTFFFFLFFFFFMHCIQLASGWETVLCGFFPPSCSESRVQPNEFSELSLRVKSCRWSEKITQVLFHNFSGEVKKLIF